MSNYPRMLYKFPGNEEMHGASFATLIVNDEAEHEDANDNGWASTTTEAREFAEAQKLPAPVPVVQIEQKPEEAEHEEDAPDRDALKAEAKELGLEFPKNVPTDRLAEMVAEAKAKE